MNFKEWVRIIASMLAIVIVAGAVGVWAGDTRWVTHTQIDKQFARMEINAMDRQITFLQIKINQDEATNSERIYIESLKQQLRAMEGNKE